MRRWLVLNGVLVVIVLGLAVQIARTWARVLPPAGVGAGGKGADVSARGGEGGKRGKRAAAAAEKAAQTPASIVTAIAGKDLFDPSRQKPSEETTTQVLVHETAPPPGITLAGIRILGRDHEAFIADATQANAQRRIRRGDPVGNFTVKSIGKSSVVLVSEAGDIVTLTLEVDKTKSGGAPGRVARGQPAGAGAGSPAAGVSSGASTAAGPGAAKTAAGTATASAAAATTTTLPPGTTPPAGAPPAATAKHTQPQVPQLPAGVREKIEQMKRDRGK